ncbi:MAG: YncE family protein [Gammaproteobacteria bacterium]|nr:YncE family protein [Gammaproteobacteria bacterium]
MPNVLPKFLLLCLAWLVLPAQAEILAMMNYETKSADSLKTLKLTAPQPRREGIAVVDVDPASPRFGQTLVDIPLPPDLVAHHIFYDRTMTKAYVTALGKGELRVIDMTRNPYRVELIEVPGCKFGEDVIFNEANTTWYLTCMASANVFVGDVATDTVQREIKLPGTFPHGLAVHTGIDRVLVTSTVSADLKDAREIVTELRASTDEVLGTHKLSNKPSPSGEAPVEILFVPGSTPPVAYVTNMFGGTLWAMRWNPESQGFDTSQAFDFNTLGVGVVLEIYFDAGGKTLFVTTAKPGKMHVFDLSAGPLEPKLVRTFDAAEGAHHVGFTRDGRYAFVQNALLNLPGMSDGSVSVIDLQKNAVVASMDALKEAGLNPNSIVLLPEWNALAGH